MWLSQVSSAKTWAAGAAGAATGEAGCRRVTDTQNARSGRVAWMICCVMSVCRVAHFQKLEFSLGKKESVAEAV